MKLLDTKTHGCVDYIAGATIAATPFMLKFKKGSAETILPVAAGAGALLYSFFTDYETGVVRKIPMRTHLALDLFSGLLLAASPWLFGFSKKVYKPHVLMGVFEIVAALSTQTKAGDKK